MNIVCDLDVHKDSIFACVMKENGEKTIREVVHLITQGESQAEVLLKALHKRTVNKHGTKILTAALSGFITEENRQVIHMAMERIQLLERQMKECLCKMEQITDMHYKEKSKECKPYRGLVRKVPLKYWLSPDAT